MCRLLFEYPIFIISKFLKRRSFLGPKFAQSKKNSIKLRHWRHWQLIQNSNRMLNVMFCVPYVRYTPSGVLPAAVDSKCVGIPTRRQCFRLRGNYLYRCAHPYRLMFITVQLICGTTFTLFTIVRAIFHHRRW